MYLSVQRLNRSIDGSYVQPPLPFTGANALPPEDDGTMAATRDAIATSLVP